MGDGERQVIELRLERAHDMFEMPQSDPFSEHHSFLTGVEFCVSELRGRHSGRPVRLEIGLPASEVDDGLPDRMSRALGRYCDYRRRYNRREGQALRLAGVRAFWLGLPITLLGLALIVAATKVGGEGDTRRLVLDHLGWVLAWIGLWFPLDELLFYPLAYGQENRVLSLLCDAEVVVVPWSAVAR